VHSLARNTSGVGRCVGASGWGLGRSTSKLIIHTNLHKPNNKLVNVYSKHFGARMSHGQTQTHKTPHNLDLGEATTFPLTILFVHGHGAMYPNFILS